MVEVMALLVVPIVVLVTLVGAALVVAVTRSGSGDTGELVGHALGVAKDAVTGGPRSPEPGSGTDET